ncbi:MAG TPA: hypothetical protein VL651_09910 [Bacteroidia bacterium]|nr:hypothetical protein [Bacteroidia bacterium]
MLRNLTQKFYVQLILLFAGFAICRILCNAVFFEGFLSTFSTINSRIRFLGNLSLFTHVPYFSSSIILSSLCHPFFLLLILLLYVPFVMKRKELHTVFSSIPGSDRIIICVCALLLAWELSTYDYNYYLDHAFYFDRILLVVLALLLFRFPVLTPFFIAAAFVYRSQFNYPVDGFPLFDKRLLFDILEMFLVFAYLKFFIREFRVSFLFAVLCIVGGNYFMSAIGKMLISPHGYEWLTQDNVADLFANVHQRGWIAENGHYQTLRGFIEKFGTILKVLLFITEFAGLFLLRSRKWAMILLSSFFIMHIGIFIFGSMLFWKWMAVDVTLALIILRDRKNMTGELFTGKFFLASLVVIATSFIWLQPYRIAWFDTKAALRYSFYAIDENGKEYNVDRNMMNPYHQWFEYDHFGFLLNAPMPNLTSFGYTSQYHLMHELDSVNTEGIDMYNLPKGEEGIYRIQDEMDAAFVTNMQKLATAGGKNSFDSLKKSSFDSFIQQYFRNRNRMIGQTFFPALFSAPAHLYSSVPSPAYDGKEKIVCFRVESHLVTIYDDCPISADDRVVDLIYIPN